jgi:hypothetical protein
MAVVILFFIKTLRKQFLFSLKRAALLLYLDNRFQRHKQNELNQYYRKGWQFKR